MKLLNYTTTYFALILIILLSVWAVIFYFEYMDEIYDSIDDSLDNQKILIIRKAKEDLSILEKTAFEDNNYQITPTNPRLAQGFLDSYRDTLMYMENEEEFEPVRLLESVFRQDNSYYKIKVVTSMVEEDDLIKELFFSLLWLYFGLILSILVLNNILHKRVWRPFYKLLSRLENFSIEKNTHIKFENTQIEEFQLLNERVEQLIKKSVDSYNSQKEFIENASHELQTPLAISINKLELMAENSDLNAPTMEQLGAVLENLERLTRLNKSLLLLSRIENRQFLEQETLNFNQLIKDVISEFEDLTAHRAQELQLEENDDLNFSINKDLARILISNLLKNAILHSSSESDVFIKIDSKQIIFINSGEKSLPAEKLFTRFQAESKTGSTGLGLAISKAIADKYNLRLQYDFLEDRHEFSILF